MNYAFAVKWLKAFRTSSEAVCKLYNDDFLFEDLMLDQSITDKDDLHRVFAPYANTDRTNGIGVHNFRIRGYVGDERSGLIRWEWSPEDAAIFLGLDVKDRPFWTQGHTFHVYNEDGTIARESSWWDAAQVVRSVSEWKPTKNVTPIGSGAAAAAAKAPGDAPQAPGDLAYAERWGRLLSSDTAAFADLYAQDGDFCVERHMMDDHMNDTISDRATLIERLSGFANSDADNGIGVHTFTVTEYIGDARYGMVHWDYSVEHASHYRGLPAGGKSLQTKGSTFLQFNSEGKIVLESTCFNDNPVFQELGIPVMTVHYWDADFDPAALLAG